MHKMSSKEFLNKRPIFVVGFTRGGTNILLNLILSHPQATMPRGEFQVVFYGTGRMHFLGSINNKYIRNINRIRILPYLLLEKKDIFSVNRWEPRNEISFLTRKLIDRKLYYDRMKALSPGQNLYKNEDEKYSKEEIARTRLVCKNIDGLIFFSKELSKMYPKATFIALIRNGFAVCEGHIRRGWTAEEIAHNYELGCQQMIKDSKQLPNYHILRFEDIIKEPKRSLTKIYKLVDLDIKQLTKVRLNNKPVINEEGRHQQVVQEKQKSSNPWFRRFADMFWYDIEDFSKHFRKDVNKNQIRRLTKAQKNIILRNCRFSLRYFGYI